LIHHDVDDLTLASWPALKHADRFQASAGLVDRLAVRGAQAQCRPVVVKRDRGREKRR
jgi:hypothetical protein